MDEFRVDFTLEHLFVDPVQMAQNMIDTCVCAKGQCDHPTTGGAIARGDGVGFVNGSPSDDHFATEANDLVDGHGIDRDRRCGATGRRCEHMCDFKAGSAATFGYAK